MVTLAGVLLLAECQASATHEVLQASPVSTIPKKNHVTNKSPVGDISAVTLIRTDTTLDHSQKAEKVCLEIWRQAQGTNENICKTDTKDKFLPTAPERWLQLTAWLSDNAHPSGGGVERWIIEGLLQSMECTSVALSSFNSDAWHMDEHTCLLVCWSSCLLADVPLTAHQLYFCMLAFPLPVCLPLPWLLVLHLLLLACLRCLSSSCSGGGAIARLRRQ